MSNVSDMWVLQQTDLAVEAIRRRLKELEHQRGETPALKAAREAYRAANAELVHWRTTRRDLEIQARELSAKIEAADRDLMSGRVRNPKELEGMNANVASMKKRLSAIEDQVLDAMVQNDQWQVDSDARKSELDAAEADWQAMQAANAAEVTAKLADLKRLASQMNQQWASLSPEDQQLYRDLRSRKEDAHWPKSVTEPARRAVSLCPPALSNRCATTRCTPFVPRAGGCCMPGRTDPATIFQSCNVGFPVGFVFDKTRRNNL